MTVTVLGADGFIGSHVVRHLQSTFVECRAVGRGDCVDENLGDVIDCVGVTADFRTRPYDAVDAHVSRVVELLRAGNFDSYLYLSSTRVYRRAESGSEETVIPVVSSDPDDLYAISKLAGEAVCLRYDDPQVRVARLSNVYGPGAWAGTFLASVIRSAILDARVVLDIGQSSARDFVSISDVATVLPLIARAGRHRLYNVASGRNIPAGDLVRDVCRLTGSALVGGDGPVLSFPIISIDRLQRDLGFCPVAIADQLPALIAAYREELKS
ncbi:MAG TPA: NAD(P)-dependent oxidoreductase [Acidimicrobiales bacterium]|nr:NAD(P)-dependent oxidoreductase [Acidimicrobiales bacterium]